MSRNLVLGLLTFVLLGSSCCAPGEPTREGELLALTYNVHGLPPIVTNDDTPGRMELISPLLNGFDIVGLQEDFEDDYHAALVAEAEYPTEVRFAEPLPGRGYGSGLALLALLPELEHFFEHFEDCEGYTDHASDCLASKGFQMIRLDLGHGLTLDVYNTHMEAGGSEDDDLARSTQTDQIIAAMARLSQGAAILFLGDTNCHGDDPEDAALIERLVAEIGLTDACDALGCPEPGRIDRLMFRGGDDLTLEPVEWTVEEAFFDGEGVPLSDHDAISTRFAWRQRSE